MPTYEYKCENCGHLFEMFQSITANPIKKCPNCGKLKLNRLIGIGSGVIFKGSGFYETDYRSENYKNSAKPQSDKATSTTEEKPKTANETKPEVKTETKPAETKTSSKKSEKS